MLIIGNCTDIMQIKNIDIQNKSKCTHISYELTLNRDYSLKQWIDSMCIIYQSTADIEYGHYLQL